jgi:DNA-binding response OmpR family regulator
MCGRGVSPKVLILDDDLAFLLWLGEPLSAAGFEPIPALSVGEAERMLHALRRPIDLVILNPTLVGVREFSQKLRQVQAGDGPILAALLPETGELDTSVPGVSALLRKPLLTDEGAKKKWVNTIREILRS